MHFNADRANPRVDFTTLAWIAWMLGSPFFGPGPSAQVFDFGDAPDPTYPTSVASTGAMHAVGGGVYLGACIDAESDGQPSAAADGDDSAPGAVVVGTCASAGDDEDGVVFTSNIDPGGTANVTVTASAPCTLSGWIDFSGDGDWNDAGEDLFPGGAALVAGANSLIFPVPSGIPANSMTHARFRCTTDGAVSYTGSASDGEVEDYTITTTPVELISFLVE